MIKIGDFARLGQVSVPMLRHYDELGLLRPARVDNFTGYRLYEVRQLATLNRLLALKDLGFSLVQIGEVLDGVTQEQLRGMLQRKHAEVALLLASDTARLARIAARLKEIEQEDDMPEYKVVIKEIPDQLLASRRVTIPSNDQVPAVLAAAFDEVYELLRTEKLGEGGPCMAIWHQGAEILENEDAEAAVPIDRAAAGTDRVTVYTLSGGAVASVLHHGAFDGMKQAHAVLLSWIEANGYRNQETYREVYLQEATSGQEAITEIQYPVGRP
ncbi:MAG: MerR family transcriptional regulator [Tepidiformaceae bacterium]